MIKYIEFDSFDEAGQHIIPANSLYDLNKTASLTYSPEISRVLASIKKIPERYYVVINALGSYEAWGCNRNGDAFPEDALKHVSLRTDMGTPNDYGYKTFEYYAKWFRNHVNKSDSPSFGDVIFAHWNPSIRRVELIVAIDATKDAETIKAIDGGELVSVSMGCRVPHDFCCICGNQAKTRKEYCIHARDYLGEIVTEEMARKWSAQLGKTILPGTQVFVWNKKPKFFDISKVFIGADRTSYVLGKAAARRTKAISSLNLAEAYGITDAMIEKASAVRKSGEIDKEIGGALGPTDIDGSVSKVEPAALIQKAVHEKINRTITAEPTLPAEFLNGIAKTRSLPSIFSTMLGLGMFPKPAEVQRIVLVHVGQQPMADELERNNQIFDYESEPDECLEIPDSFDDSLSRIMTRFLAERSSCPHFILPRMEYIDKQGSLDKCAFYSSTMGNDYWIDQNPSIGFKHQPIVSPSAGFLTGIAALYAGLKAKSMGIDAGRMANIFTSKPWLAALIGGGVMYSLYSALVKHQNNDNIMMPANAYEDILQNTNLSGHIKKSSVDKTVTSLGRGLIAAGIAFPSAYFVNAINQKSLQQKGVPVFPVPYLDIPKTAITTGGVVALAPKLKEIIKKSLKK